MVAVTIVADWFVFFCLQLQPESIEEFINFLIEHSRLDEAAQKLEEAINRADFISKKGKSKHQV